MLNKSSWFLLLIEANANALKQMLQSTLLWTKLEHKHFKVWLFLSRVSNSAQLILSHLRTRDGRDSAEVSTQLFPAGASSLPAGCLENLRQLMTLVMECVCAYVCGGVLGGVDFGADNKSGAEVKWQHGAGLNGWVFQLRFRFRSELQFLTVL